MTTHDLTTPKAIAGALLSIIALVGAGAILPISSTNPIAQTIQSILVIVGCIVALYTMGAIDMIIPTRDAFKKANNQLSGIFKTIIIGTITLLVIRLALDTNSAIATVINIPYYIARYIKVAIFEETLFRVALLFALVRWCNKRGTDYTPAIAISTLIFVLPHFNTYYLTHITAGMVGLTQLTATAFLGACAAKMTIKTDNLLAAIILHFSVDTLLAISAGAYTAGINQPFSSGFDVICAIVINMVTIFALQKWFRKHSVY